MGMPRLAVCVFLASLAAICAESDVSEQFYNAIRRDDARVVTMLLRSGADVNVKDTRGGTPLMYAAAVGSEAMMRQLVEAGADVNAKNSFGTPALIFAAGSLSRVRLLVEHGADVNARTNRGNTSLLVAAKYAGSLETIKLLLAKGAKLDTQPAETRETPAAAAAYANDTTTLRFLLDRDAEHGLAGPAGPIALMSAAKFGNVPAVKLLLSKGVDVNAPSPEDSGRVKNGPIAIGHLTALMFDEPPRRHEATEAFSSRDAPHQRQRHLSSPESPSGIATDHNE